MNIIAVVDRNWAIGKSGHRLVSIPAEQQLLQSETLGKVVVMGRKTLLALPGGRPLYGRTNIILSEKPGFIVKGATVCNGAEQVFESLRPYCKQDIFIIGGASVYRQFLPYCETAHITYIDYEYEADTFFPDLNRDQDWQLDLVSEEQTYFDLCYEFRMYTRKCINI